MLTIFRDDLTRSNASKAPEVGGEDCSWVKGGDGHGNELSILEMGLDGL